MADKVFMFLILTFSMSLLLYMAGITDDNNSIKLILSTLSGDFKANELWLKALGEFAIAIGVVGAASLIFGNSSAVITAATIAMAKWLVDYATDIFDVIQKAALKCPTVCVNTVCTHVCSEGINAVGYWILVAILAPLGLAFAYSLYQYAFGGGGD